MKSPGLFIRDFFISILPTVILQFIKKNKSFLIFLGFIDKYVITFI